MKTTLAKCVTEQSLRRARVLARQAISGGLALCTALLMVSSGHARAADTALEVTYLEVPVAAVADTHLRLQQHARHARAAAVYAGTAASVTFRIDVLQEIGRPERWVLLEWGESQGQLEAIDAAAATDLTPLQSVLMAPTDQRSNHPLPEPGGAADAVAASAARVDDRQLLRSAVYSVSHLDIGAPQQSVVIAAVADLVNGARRARGNLRAEAWQQNGRANHYALLFVWRDRADRDAFAGTALVRRFRNRIAPLLGSPYDERLFRLAD